MVKKKEMPHVVAMQERKDHTATLMAAAVVGAWITIQFFLLTHSIDVDMREIIIRTLGTLDTSLGLVLSYYFGSSASSKDKDATIKHITGEPSANTTK